MNSDKLRVLAYHGVEDISNFTAQLQYLSKNFSIIDVNVLNEHFFEGRKLPKNPLLITFDDGDLSVWQKGVPLLEKFSIPSVCFVITDLINTEKPFWWEEIRYYLGKEKGFEKSWEVKNWKNEDRVAYLEELRKNSSKPPITRVQLNESQLNKMKESGVDIANHSHTHPMLDQCSAENVREEISKSISILNSMGFKDKIFAYPNGNFDLKVEEVLKEKGIKMAFLFDHKLNKNKINPLRISRIRVDTNIPLEEFQVKVSGLHPALYNNFVKNLY
ncbi:polysaccharide deacetylase family protein [Antarcticibacterium sp. 1MA-6-2]|uniref:polysaccharide deacetylase family protein n=1 Tax=Antarcticibacterium sp. 1MA-6-2 TaxID=2908210 RepID=UPI001F1CFC30|nr:polysaccharide deacetylase family protein [Antarcticibacterium sp. 1MA-6-2]UJH91314.1 polysaccharide deacetylase family protein [Antarcticibacterium sp. 1MA-6-2]